MPLLLFWLKYKYCNSGICTVVTYIFCNVISIETTLNRCITTHGCKQSTRCGILVGNQYTTPSTYHLQTVLTSIPHHLHITYKHFQLVYHIIYISPTNRSNQYTTPSTYHLQTVPTSILPHSPHITYTLQYHSPYHHNISLHSTHTNQI